MYKPGSRPADAVKTEVAQDVQAPEPEAAPAADQAVATDATMDQLTEALAAAQQNGSA